ncbi:unnamed protein product [Caenorhabditis sp. 36 PRJEB53466]|nr:unnamed protein product [Caenorhabditis sp. 36 PRJEB53466]
MTALPIETYNMIDQISCPECTTWTRDDCKVLINAIRTEKKNQETKASFLCSYCNAVFRTVRHLVQHKRICSSQPAVLENHEEEEDGDEVDYMEEMIVEQEEEVIGIDEYVKVEEEHEKPSTSSYDSAVPPHRQTPRGIPPHHAPPNKMMPPMEKLKFPVPASRHRGSQTKCPECTVTVESIEELMVHCRDKHESEDRKFCVERQLFEARDEFRKWFDQRQEDTCTSLTKRTGHGGETFYRCHRVGKYQSVAKARKSNPRKIDQTCTAYLKVFVQEDGSVWANGCFTHIGHELDHKLLWLTETQENYVRELIDLNWTSDQIFFYIRDEYKNYECKLKYISKNDIRNITVRYNREKTRRHGVDNGSKKNAKNIDEEIIEKEMQIQKYEEIKEGIVTFPEESDDETKTKRPRISSSSPPSSQEKPENLLPAQPNTEDENEYINVVDDEPCPILEKIPV